MTYEKMQPSVRLTILDSMRGLAAVIVCFHHIFKFNIAYIRDAVNITAFSILEVISDLNVEAVLFFFVLSGFSIGLSLKNKNLRNSSILNEYIYRRLKRILPIYWISLAFTFIAGMIMKRLLMPDYGLVNLLGNLLFIQTSSAISGSWITPYGYNGPLWSLAAEFFFYCFFPIVFFVNEIYLKGISLNIKFLVMILLSLIALFVNKIVFVPYLIFFNGFSIWLIGYLCSITYLRGKRFDGLFFGCFLAATIFLIFGDRILVTNSFTKTCKGLVMGGVFYLITVLSTQSAAFLKVVKFPATFINRCFYFVGKGSFALYALHYPLLLVLIYYKKGVAEQALSVLILALVCPLLEENTIKWKMLIFKRSYVLPSADKSGLQNLY